MKNTVIIFSIMSMAIACQHTDHTQHDHSEPKMQPVADHRFLISKEKLAQAGIQTGTFSEKNIPMVLSVGGEIALHPEHIAHVSAVSDGVVQSMRVSLNQKVQRGQVLAVVRKPDLLDVQQQYLELRDRSQFLKIERERLEILKNADATATKNFQKADAEWRAALTSQQVLAAKLRQFQIDPEQLTADNLRTEISIFSPVAGVVTAISTNLGAAVQLGSPICSVADLQQLHADFWVFEKDLARVKLGQKVQVSPQSDSKMTLEATISSIDPSLNVEKKAVRVHAKFAGAAGQNLTVGVFSEGKIEVGAGEKSMAVPAAAVVRENDGEFIFLQKESTESGIFFEKVPVKTLGTSGEFVAVELEKPLPAGAKIVLRGAYYISAEGSGVADDHAH